MSRQAIHRRGGAGVSSHLIMAMHKHCLLERRSLVGTSGCQSNRTKNRGGFLAQGLDGIELPGTHGYLLQQSLSSFANNRKDRWGEHLHFAKTLTEHMRRAIRPDALLGFRLCIDDLLSPEQGGVGHEGLRAIGAELIATSHFDYLNHSDRTTGSYRYPYGGFLPLTRGLKTAIQSAVPVIGVGKIPRVDLAERTPQEGDRDLRHAFSGAITPMPADLVVAGIHPKPNMQLHDVLRRHAPVTLVGDAMAPRSALEAIREGDRAGRTLS